MTVLVTGATGFLGSYVAARMLGEGAEVLALVRGDDPQARLDAVLAPLGASGARAIPGDLTGDVELPRSVTAIVHCAADVRFDRPLEDARAINVDGTRRLLAAASALPSLERLVHVSTAYVAGRDPRRFGEDDGDRGQAHRNTYEQTKLEAEGVVRASGLPARIVRPSIVVGDSATGWTSSFNVLYHPLQAYARGLVTRLPADPHCVVDVVPVDHVADVVMAALHPRCHARTLHAVAGDDALTASELAALASRVLGRPPLALVDAKTLAGEGGEILDALDAYYPYFTVRGRFDAARARELGLRPPRLEDYFERLIEYARAARWGRRAVGAAA